MAFLSFMLTRRPQEAATRGNEWESSLSGPFALCLVVCAAQTGSADDRQLYKNPTAPVSARVEDLLGRMTLEEKVAQLEAVWQGKIAIFDDKF
jgi:beta-glucosidase